MFIYSSCRLRGGQQQIWPDHYANAVSTNGRLASKTLNIALSDLFNELLIRKETNTGTCLLDPDLEETHIYPFEKDLAHAALAVAATFFLANSICAHSWIVCLPICKGSRCLKKATSLQAFQWSSQGARKNEAKHCKSVDATVTHRPYSSLRGTETPWVHWWDAV